MGKATFNIQITNPSGEALRAIRNVIVTALPPDAGLTLRISLAVDVNEITDSQAIAAKQWFIQNLKDYVTQPISLTCFS